MSAFGKGFKNIIIYYNKTIIMDILITKKNTKITTPETVNFTALLAHSDINTLPLQSRFIELLNEEFTEEEQKLYIANLYMYLNYDSTTDFPINLETVYKMIGFANKGNAMKTIKSNFTKDEDYKLLIIPREKKQNAGRSEHEIMLNVDTFKSLCMLVKTPEGKKIRKYYVKLENVNNKITKEQLENKDKLLQEKESLLIEQELKNQRQEILINEKDAKLNNLTRKVTKYPAGKAVYAYETVFEGKKVKKVGKAKDVNKRITDHRTADPDVDIFYSIKCYDHHLFEKTCHFLLDKWRVSKNREFFDCSTQIIKNVMNYTKLILENNINFETICVDEITDFFDTFTENKIDEQNKNEDKNIQQDEELQLPVHPEINIVLKDCNNFELFLQECCDTDDNSAECTHKEIVNQYKIWCKTSNKEQCNKLINFFKTRFTSIKKKLTNAFKSKKEFFVGIKIKSEFYEFINGESIIEKFLFEKCKRSPNYQISKTELFDELKSESDIIKNKILNYFDINFTRTRIGDVVNKKDLRQRGYLGVALKTNNNPENIIKKMSGHPKKVYQIEVSTKKVIREFDSQTLAAEFMNVSPSVMYLIMKTGRQRDNYIFSYNKII